MRTAKKEKKTKGFFIRTKEELHKEFKLACIRNGTDMTDVLEKFMIKYSKTK